MPVIQPMALQIPQPVLQLPQAMLQQPLMQPAQNGNLYGWGANVGPSLHACSSQQQQATLPQAMQTPQMNVVGPNLTASQSMQPWERTAQAQMAQLPFRTRSVSPVRGVSPINGMSA